MDFCRYYKGEEHCPYEGGEDALFWGYEQKWIELTLAKSDYLGEMLDDYLSAGLEDFAFQDETPITLKAILFNRYCHWNGGYGLTEDAKAFQLFYHNTYKKEGDF